MVGVLFVTRNRRWSLENWLVACAAISNALEDLSVLNRYHEYAS